MNFLPQFLKSPEYEKRVTTQAGISEEWRDSYPFHPKLGLMKSWRVVSKALYEEREKLGGQLNETGKSPYNISIINTLRILTERVIR